MTELELLREITRLLATREAIDALPLPADVDFKAAIQIALRREGMSDVHQALNLWLNQQGRDGIYTAFMAWLEQRKTQIDAQITARKDELKALWAPVTP